MVWGFCSALVCCGLLVALACFCLASAPPRPPPPPLPTPAFAKILLGCSIFVLILFQLLQGQPSPLPAPLSPSSPPPPPPFPFPIPPLPFSLKSTKNGFRTIRHFRPSIYVPPASPPLLQGQPPPLPAPGLRVADLGGWLAVVSRLGSFLPRRSGSWSLPSPRWFGPALGLPACFSCLLACAWFALGALCRSRFLPCRSSAAAAGGCNIRWQWSG